ncbi:GNAT family N-acetyltransferase [Pseudodesulfovibrio cashew]|nr:GNAT family N-acetyltransferase [Pseudodesulfovibrio cashew]
MELTVFQNSEALRLLLDKRFVEEWQSLADQCGYVTVFLEPDFVISWFKVYLRHFDPILFVGRGDNDELVGLLFVCRQGGTGKLYHVGLNLAEYHGFLALDNFLEEFIINSLTELKRLIGTGCWDWGWLPPGLGTGWRHSDVLKAHDIFVSLESEESPIYSLLDDARYRKLRKNKSNKNQLNRFLKRAGFSFYRVTSPDEVNELVGALANQYEFRKIALYRKAPFRQDPLRSVFLKEAFKNSELSHLSVMKVEGRPVAIHYGFHDDSTFYLTLPTFDPAESRNSPGKIYLLKLMEHLIESGYEKLDLTPGKDAYKSKFSNGVQSVSQAKLYFSRRVYLAFIAKERLKAMIKRAGLDQPWLVGKDSIPRKLAGKMAAIVGVGLVLQKALPRWKSGAASARSYFVATQKVAMESALEACVHMVTFNRYDDLLGDDCRNIERESVHLKMALDHFDAGDTLVTVTSGESLIHSGWLIEDGVSRLSACKVGSECEKYFVYDLVSCAESISRILLEGVIYSIRKHVASGGGEGVIFSIPESEIEFKSALSGTHGVAPL